MSQRNIADESARARKILSKNESLQLSSSTKKKVVTNTSDSSVGEFGSILVCGPAGTDQYTICRPIGYTDLDEKSWTIIKTDEVQQALLRLRDPNSEKLNRARSKQRTDELVMAGILNIVENEGRKVSYYAGHTEASRASVLDAARKEQKARKRELSKELESLPKKGSATRRGEINDELQKAGKLTCFMSTELRAFEEKVLRFLSNPELERKVTKANPVTFRTLVGPFGNEPQREIRGARGLPLVDVMSRISNWISSGTLSGGTSEGSPQKAPGEVDTSTEESLPTTAEKISRGGNVVTNFVKTKKATKKKNK